MKKIRSRSMTEGVIWKKIILFSIPLLIGNIFQQLYNTVDSYVVGNYVGDDALAAVGASGPLINLLISFFMGISTGAGILVARYYGGRKHEEVSETVHTFMAFSLLISLFLTFIGLCLSPYILRWLKTPAEIMPQATSYLRVYFWGSLFLIVYNSGSGILRAVGDAKNPLIYLIISSLINITLDLLFVIRYDMGIFGVALATLIAQMVSAIMVVIHLRRIEDSYQLVFNKLHFHLDKLYEIIRLGIPTGVQQTVVSFSNVLVQSYVNSFGEIAMAAVSAADKFNAFLSMPINSFNLAITTFTGQNLGAGKKDRVLKGIHTTIVIAFITITIVGIPTYLYAEDLIAVFSKNPKVMQYGARQLRIMLPFYTFLSVNNILSGALRGAGKTAVPMVIMITSFTVIRQIFLFIAMRINRSIDMVFWSYSVTWAISSMLTVAYYRMSRWADSD